MVSGGHAVLGSAVRSRTGWTVQWIASEQQNNERVIELTRYQKTNEISFCTHAASTATSSGGTTTRRVDGVRYG